MYIQRLKILIITISLVFVVVISRLFYWQVVKGPEYKEKALSQTYKLEKLQPQRGQIHTSDGFPVVQNQSVYTLSIYKPNLKQDLETVLNKIAEVHPGFNDENKRLLQIIREPNQKWVTFTTKFDRSQSLTLGRIPGLSLTKDYRRYYPELNLSQNLLGIVGKDKNGQPTGYGGLEGYYNKHLEGKSGFVWQAKDATGKTLISQTNWESQPLNGRDLHISINRDLQYLIETALKQGVDQYQADSGMITVLQPQTGAVIAMADYESTSSATPSASLVNPIISHLFEPGSIFKPIIVAMALDKKAISTDYVCTQCNRPLVISGYTIDNWNQEIHPDSSLKDIIKNSDNIGMSHIIRQLGLKSFLSYYNNLGLTQKSGVDLQGEAKPQTKDYWPEVDLATASFGQGIALTQLQMLTAFNALANDGVLVRPHLVEYLSEDGKQIKVKGRTAGRKVFSPQTAKEIKDILKYAVENGVVTQFKPKDMEACAKSGTAQVAVKGGYTDDSTVASYIGFSPCTDPKFSMIVTINRPRTTPWGASSAAPIWYKLAENLDKIL